MSEVLSAIIFILPAYVANASPVISKGRRAIDLNKTFLNGRPLLGKNKTVEGFTFGLVTGSLVGLLIGRPVEGFLLAMGALLGDLWGSFVKRRLGLEPGAPLPLIDQLSFLYGGFLLFMVGQAFMLTVERLTWITVVILTIITPILHLLSNVVAYFMGLKGRPW
jgi:CDP-2,3-bis-(O-geranylgeranyl)-sn-glycerol synthase